MRDNVPRHSSRAKWYGSSRGINVAVERAKGPKPGTVQGVTRRPDSRVLRVTVRQLPAQVRHYLEHYTLL